MKKFENNLNSQTIHRSYTFTVALIFHWHMRDLYSKHAQNIVIYGWLLGPPCLQAKTLPSILSTVYIIAKQITSFKSSCHDLFTSWFLILLILSLGSTTVNMHIKITTSNWNDNRKSRQYIKWKRLVFKNKSMYFLNKHFLT